MADILSRPQSVNVQHRFQWKLTVEHIINNMMLYASAQNLQSGER